MDQAGWHMSKKLDYPENIRISKIPPYSPELNPAEHIWDDLREKNFLNRAFRSLDEVEETLCRGLNAMSDQPSRLRSLTNFPYMTSTH